MTKAERVLQGYLQEENNVETVAGVSRSAGVSAELANIKGNLPFKAQFDINVKLVLADSALGTVILPSELPDPLKQSLPVFIFGNSDFAGGFAKSYQLLPPPTIWRFVSLGIIGRDLNIISSYVSPFVKSGDLVYTYGGLSGKTYTASIIISCDQVAYGTMLDSISSDRFVINNIRYSVPVGSEAQLNNQINLIRQSLFGKLANDFVSPSAYTTQDSFQKNIVDVPLVIGVDKNLCLATYIDYTVPSFRWTVFVLSTEKLANPLPVRQ